jgi:hypothetical protein
VVAAAVFDGRIMVGLPKTALQIRGIVTTNKLVRVSTMSLRTVQQMPRGTR